MGCAMSTISLNDVRKNYFSIPEDSKLSQFRLQALTHGTVISGIVGGEAK